MNRSEELKSERRRRNTDALGGKRRRLQVDESKLDQEKFVYRWANDEGSRINDLTRHDDWEVVADRNSEVKQDTRRDGSKVSVVAGTGERGAPVNAVLLRKPKGYHEDDYAAQQRKIDEAEKGMRAGAAPGADQSGLYQPSEKISITHGD